jgi:hypothetical protein
MRFKIFVQMYNKVAYVKTRHTQIKIVRQMISKLFLHKNITPTLYNAMILTDYYSSTITPEIFSIFF